MNKKEIAEIRKEFKEEAYKLKLKEFYSVFVKKDNGILYKELCHFDSKDSESKELYYNNFKKVLSSAIDTKLFELDFQTEEEVNQTQNILNTAVNSKDKVEYEGCLDKMAEKVMLNYNCDTDYVINLVKCEYYKGSKRKKSEDIEVMDETLQAFEFVLCSINKVETQKKAMTFDFETREFCPNSSVEVVINLNSPLEGFMFPAFEGGYSNVNKIVYYSSKAKQLNSTFVEEVLNCSTKFTAEDEKECFHNIITTIVGNKVKSETIQEIYTKISEKGIEAEEEEDAPATIGVKDIKRILQETGITEVDNLEEVFEQNCGVNYDFKVNNVLPNLNAKSIKISSETADINITPKDLSLVRQVKDKNGKKCLLIEITDDVVINGFELETEEV